MMNDARPKLEISDASFNTRRLEYFEGKANGQKLARYVYQWANRESARLSANSKFEFEIMFNLIFDGRFKTAIQPAHNSVTDEVKTKTTLSFD